MDQEAKAFAMFDDGAKTNAVATALFKGNWGKAKKAKTAWDARQGGATAIEKPDAEAQGEEDGPRVWEVGLQVPEALIGAAIAGIPPEEIVAAVAAMEDGFKSDLFKVVMQRRIDAMLAGMD
jgi:hypothetical protein